MTGCVPRPKSCFTTLSFRVLPVTAEPYGCPFSRLRGIPGRSVIQALWTFPEGNGV
jgi:hypothetical protein